MPDNVNLDILTREFPREAIKYREGGGGKRLAYIETHTCIHRLNDATGNNWDFEIIDLREMDNRYLCIGKLTIPGHGSRMGIGVQTLQNVAKQEDLVKGTASDALKKAATLFGVALELYGPDYEAETSEDAHQRPPEPRRDTIRPQMSNETSAPQPTPLRVNERLTQRPAPGQEPSDKQVNYARSLWKQLGHTVVDPDGGSHHDARGLDYHCQLLFKTDFAAINKGQMRTLIDNLLGQISAGKKGA